MQTKSEAVSKWIAALIWLTLLVMTATMKSLQNSEQPEQIDLKQPFEGWTWSDTRSLYAFNSQMSVSQILAAYYREGEDTATIRLDFFNDPDQGTLSVSYLPRRGAPEQPIAMLDLASGKLNHGTAKFAVDKLLNSIVLTLPQDLAPYLPGAQITVRLDGQGQADRQAISFPLSENKNLSPAKLLFVFDSGLQTGTPAQLLRSWDGAHTGPLGQRHGLFQLLSAANTSRIPIFITDLTEPHKRQALDSLGQTEVIQSMLDGGLLTLANTARSESLWQYQLRHNDQAEALHPSEFFLAPATNSNEVEDAYLFGALPDQNHLRLWDGSTVIPLPATDSTTRRGEWQATHRGVNPEVFADLVNLALNDDPDDLMVMGGNLSETTWGDSAVVPYAFEQVRRMPWIQVLDANSLTQIKALPFDTGSQVNCVNILCQQQPPLPAAMLDNLATVKAGLISLPGNPIADLAWRTYSRLIDPEVDPDLWLLKLSALEQVNRLIAAAHWSSTPQNYAGCGTGLHGTDCILANETDMLFIDQRDGTLLTAFHRSANEVTQWTAPYTQVTGALGSPDSWVRQDDYLMDPALLPGSFAGLLKQNVQVEISSEGTLIFHDADGHPIAYSLTSDGPTINLNHSASSDTAMLFSSMRWVPDDHLSCAGPDKFAYDQGGSRLLDFSLENASLLDQVNASDSPIFHGEISEDPNFEYPSGHFMPMGFSLARIKFEPPVEARIKIRFNPEFIPKSAVDEAAAVNIPHSQCSGCP